jgi:hypothetical protein
MYGNQINDGCLNVLKYAPILMMSVQYWAFTNKAIFKNESTQMQYQNAPAYNQQHLINGFD